MLYYAFAGFVAFIIACALVYSAHAHSERITTVFTSDEKTLLTELHNVSSALDEGLRRLLAHSADSAGDNRVATAPVAPAPVAPAPVAPAPVAPAPVAPVAPAPVAPAPVAPVAPVVATGCSAQLFNIQQDHADLRITFSNPPKLVEGTTAAGKSYAFYNMASSGFKQTVDLGGGWRLSYTLTFNTLK